MLLLYRAFRSIACSVPPGVLWGKVASFIACYLFDRVVFVVSFSQHELFFWFFRLFDAYFCWFLVDFLLLFSGLPKARPALVVFFIVVRFLSLKYH
jgi:hypothetical protein